MSFSEWPIGQIQEDFKRPELKQLLYAGYKWNEPYEIVELFEDKVAKFSGSRYAIAVDCCSNAIFLILKFLNSPQKIKIPYYTYASVPMQIKHAGYEVEFVNMEWSGVYKLEPLDVWDGAGRWNKGMYCGGYHALSFQIKKRLPIGRGGMILCDDYQAYQWFKKASYDGRDITKGYLNDNIEIMGWHMYMTPEDAARGILLMDKLPEINEDTHTHKNYKDLRDNTVFKNVGI